MDIIFTPWQSIRIIFIYFVKRMIFLDVINFFREILKEPGSIFNPETLILYGGLVLLFLMVFAETGIFFCFFFPGDSLVFTAGVLTSTGDLHRNVCVVSLTMIVAATLGNIVGYWFGRQAGPLLFKRKESIFFKHEYLIMADKFYQKYGPTALILGRFLPVIRTFAPILSGVIRVDFRKFFLFSVIGAIVWVLPLVTAGFFLGTQPVVRDNLEYIIIGMVIVFTGPIIIRFIRESRKLKKENDQAA
ncbi:MAG: VTT domain-containing protein [Chitinophagales bacterium]|nr:VTT domain-containing protein [Chitinophagales bacterium]